MSNAPPTSPPPLPPSPQRGRSLIAMGMLIPGGCVFAACLIVPIAMQSNIWPIATAFWAAVTVPVAVGVGAIFSLLLRSAPRTAAMMAFIITGLGLAIVTAILMTKVE